jgi:hypothetical protein
LTPDGTATARPAGGRSEARARESPLLEGDREEEQGGEEDGGEAHRELPSLGVLMSIVAGGSVIASFRPIPCRAASRAVR